MMASHRTIIKLHKHRTAYQSNSAAAIPTRMTSSNRLVVFAKNVWIVEGPVVNFYGFPYPTRMVVIRLSDGNSWIWSPIELKDGAEGDELFAMVQKVSGPVRHLVSPNAIHWLFLQQWQDRCPDARIYASPGLSKRKIAENLRFDAELTNTADPAYSTDIDQIHMEGGVLDEIWFFHKPTKTAIVCDMIQRHSREDLLRNTNNNKFKVWLMGLEDLIGEKGSTPKEWIFSFWIYGLFPKARQQLNVVLNEWQPEKLIIAHGENADSNAIQVIDQCLPWIPLQPKTECCCCFPHSSSNSLESEENKKE